jgi:hypothetical protein
MLESIINYKEEGSDDDGSDHDKQSGALKLLPSGPRHLLCQLGVGFLAIVNELSHLYFNGRGRLEAGGSVC